MWGELLLPILGVMLALALLIAAYTDLKWRIIPDWLNIAIALAAPIAWFAQDMSWTAMAVQLGIGATFFLACLLQFKVGIMGGGDVKLGGALALWTAQPLILPFVIIVVLAGGFIGVIMAANLLIRGRPLFEGGFSLRIPDDDDDDDDDDAAPADHARIAPYGIAIAIGGWWVVYQQYFNHFLGMSGN